MASSPTWRPRRPRRLTSGARRPTRATDLRLATFSGHPANDGGECASLIVGGAPAPVADRTVELPARRAIPDVGVRPELHRRRRLDRTAQDGWISRHGKRRYAGLGRRRIRRERARSEREPPRMTDGVLEAKPLRGVMRRIPVESAALDE